MTDRHHRNAQTGTETYSYPGATTTATDAAGKATSTTADALGRVLSASDGSSSASYKHTVLDGLTEVTQTDSTSYSSAKTQTRTFLYSSLGRLTSATNPEADSATTYTYFPNGTLKTKTDPRGVVTTYAYDRLNRPVKKDYSATTPVTPAVRYCYDGKKYDLATDACVAASPSRTDFAVGAVTDEAVHSGGVLISRTEYTAIDRLGRVTASKQTTEGLTAKAFSYVYAAGGALQKVQYPSLRWVSYEVNGANRVKAVKNGDTGSAYYLQNASYKPMGAMAAATFGLSTANQWTESWEYNSSQQAQKLRVKKGAQTLLGLDWIYSNTANYDSPTELWVDQGTDNNGNLRTEKLSPIGAGSVDRNYGYDGANRVTSYAETGKSQTFGFDAFGNVWQTSSTGVTAMPQNGPASYQLNTSGTGVRNRIKDAQHDAAGNLQQYLLAGAQTASYDAEGRVSQISGGGVSATYTYDAGGRRVKREVGGSPTVYYVYGAGGELMAEYGGAADAVATKYLVTDHLGSTRMVLDGAGDCKQRMDYAPFGAQVPRSGEACYTGAATNGIPEFTGKQRDGETAGTSTPGLDYFGARYMSAAQGRFTSPDAPFADQHPEDPQSWNLYAYARNNPLVFVDPTGEAIELTGDQKERDELLKRLQEATGDKKGQYLYANKVDGKYYVGIYANGKDGKAGSFSELGKAAGLVGQVVGSDKVAALQLVREGTGSPAGPFKPDNPAATFLDPGNPNRTLSALLSDKAPAVLPAEVMATGLPGRTDHGLVAIHELGHAFAKFHARDRVYSGPYDVQMSLDFENAARRDKGMPLRLQHGKNVVPLPKPPR
ncbi:MAG: RHS repeat domain-containing protein [Bryobacteraceae bacterium]